MDIIRLLIIICVIGLAVYLIERYTPLDSAFKSIVKVVAVIACVLLALRSFGIF